MSQRFKDKTAIVTGSGGGIGRGIARLFHKEGGNVVISAHALMDPPTATCCDLRLTTMSFAFFRSTTLLVSFIFKGF